MKNWTGPRFIHPNAWAQRKCDCGSTIEGKHVTGFGKCGIPDYISRRKRRAAIRDFFIVAVFSSAWIAFEWFDGAFFP